MTNTPVPAGATVTDPVCGMAIVPGEAAATAEHHGTTYYFCAEECARRFREDPSSFVGTGKRAAPPTPVGASPSAVEYTCPMHPEIVRLRSGACPICGMALEPRTVTAEAVN